jgi:dUTP pyrophosphatase
VDDSNILKVKRLRPGARLPERATEGSSGLDLFACIEHPGYLVLGRQPIRVGTGVAIEFPRGLDAQVRPRSGLSAKGVGVTFGTIDSDYRGEVLVTMYLFGEQEEYRINDGDRIAQLVIVRLADLPLTEVSELTPTARGSGGHGSTGHSHLIATPKPPPISS